MRDGYSFNFTGALDAFVFDEKDPKKQTTYHGAPMKAVDVVAEFKDHYVYVEIKDYRDPEEIDEGLVEDYDKEKFERNKFNWLKNYLKYKYRDSYLYRYAEGKVDKPVVYICLLNFDNALNSRMKKDLSRELPVGKKPKRWKREIVSECHVVNLKKWNKNKKLSKWPVKKI